MASQAHHARAQAALRSIDCAKAQREANTSLRNELLDAEDHLLHVQQQFFGHKLHHQVQTIRKAADVRLQQFERGLSFSEVCKKQPNQQYMNNCNLTVPLEELTLETYYEPLRTTNVVRDTLEKIMADQGLVQRMSGKLCKETLDRMVLLTNRCEKVVEAAKVTSTHFQPFVQQMITVAQSAFDVVPIKDPLKKFVDELAKLAAQDQKMHALQLEAADDGNIAANEGYMCERVTILEAISDAITYKFQLLDREETSTLKSNVDNIQAASVSVAAGVAERKDNVTQKQKRVQADLTALEDSMRRADADDEVAASGFRQDLDSSDSLMLSNATESEEIWNQIHQLEARLQSLAAQRRDEADRRVKAVEREERRRVDMSHFRAYAGAHHEKLFSMLRSLEADELMCDMMDETLRGFAVLGFEKLAFDRMEIHNARSAALMEHLTHFRVQYLHLGELLFKKDRALEELTQRSQYALAQQELAMDSFNPRAKEFAIQKEALDIDSGKLKHEISLLQSKASLYVQAFKPTDRALQSEGKVFEHPVDELHIINKDKSVKIAAFHALEVAHKPLPKLGGHIDTSKIVVDGDRQRLEHDKAHQDRIRPPPPPGRTQPQRVVDTCLHLPEGLD